MQIQRGIKPERGDIVFDGMTFDEVVKRFRALQRAGLASRSIYVDDDGRHKVLMTSVYGDSEHDNSVEYLRSYEMVDIEDAKGKSRQTSKDRWSISITYWRSRSDDAPFDRTFPVPVRPTPANRYANKQDRPFVADRFYVAFTVPEDVVVDELRKVFKACGV